MLSKIHELLRSFYAPTRSSTPTVQEELLQKITLLAEAVEILTAEVELLQEHMYGHPL